MTKRGYQSSLPSFFSQSCDHLMCKDAAEAKRRLATYGVAIIPKVLDEGECAALFSGTWDWLEQKWSSGLTKLSRAAPNSWRLLDYMYPKHAMLHQHYGAGHSQASWDVRQNPKVVDVFRQLWGQARNEDMLTSFDGFSFGVPPETTRTGWQPDDGGWLHLDQSPALRGEQCYQAWVTALDVRPGDATLVVCEAGHLLHDEFAVAHRPKDGWPDKNWVPLSKRQRDWYDAKGAPLRAIECPAGSIVLWDSRTPHYGRGPLQTRTHPNFRCVVYVCMTPRSLADEDTLARKRRALAALKTTSHWPHLVVPFADVPSTHYGRRSLITPPPPQSPPPTLSPLGKALSGLPTGCTKVHPVGSEISKDV